MTKKAIDFPTAEQIAAAKALARACKHLVVRRAMGNDRCLQCGAELHGKRWSAPLRVPKLRRVK